MEKDKSKMEGDKDKGKTEGDKDKGKTEVDKEKDKKEGLTKEEATEAVRKYRIAILKEEFGDKYEGKPSRSRIPYALAAILRGVPNYYWGNANIINDYDSSTMTLLGSSIPTNILEAALVLGLDPNSPGIWRRSGYDPTYALTAMFEDGDRDRVELMIKYGADIKKIDMQYCLRSIVRFGWHSDKLKGAQLAIQYGAKVTAEVVNIIPERWCFASGYTAECNRGFVELWRYFISIEPKVPQFQVSRDGCYYQSFQNWSTNGRVLGYRYSGHHSLIPSLMSDRWLDRTPIPVPST